MRDVSRSAPAADGWEDVPLRDVATFTRGITFPASAKRPGQGDGLIPCLRTANVQQDVDWSDLIYVPEAYVKRADRLVRPGDILISMANSLELVGKVALVDSDPPRSTFGGFISAIRPSSRALPKYLFYALRSSEMQEAMRATASRSVNIANLALSRIGELTVPLPPLPEQQRLVEKIERLLEQSRTAREALDRIPPLLKRFRQAVLAKAFRGELTERDPNDEPASVLLERIREERRRKWEEDLRARGKDPRRAKYVEPEPPDTSGLPELPEGWAWARLGTICETTSGGTPRRNRPEFYGGQIPWVKSGELEDRPIRSTEESITEEGLTHSSAKVLQEGTILVALYGATVGKTGVLDIPAATNQAVCALMPVRGIVDRTYVVHYLRGQRTALMNASIGGAQPNISQAILREWPLPVAPAQEQHRIVAKIEAVSAQANAIENAVAEARRRAEHVDQALLARAFRGEL